MCDGGMRTSTTARSGWCRSTATSERVAVADGGHDLLAGVDEQAGEAGAQQDGVFGDHDAHGSSTITVVGPPVGLTTCIRPPRAATRSARPCRPLPRAASAPPTPSSATSTTSRSPWRAIGDRRLGGRGVLGHVGQRLVHDEVGGALDRRRRALGHVDVQGRPAPGERATTDDSAASRPRSSRIAGWMPADEVAQLGEGRLGLVVGARRRAPCAGRDRCRSAPGPGRGPWPAPPAAAGRRRAGRARCGGARPRRCRRRRRGWPRAGRPGPRAGVAAVGPRRPRASAPWTAPRPTVGHGATQHQPDHAGGERDPGAAAGPELEQPELGRPAGQVADVEGQADHAPASRTTPAAAARR